MIGDRLRKARKNKGLTQKQLAFAMNETVQVISNWERGYTPSIPHDKLSRISGILDVDVNDLLYDPEEFKEIEKFRIANEATADYITQTNDNILNGSVTDGHGLLKYLGSNKKSDIAASKSESAIENELSQASQSLIQAAEAVVKGGFDPEGKAVEYVKIIDELLRKRFLPDKS